MTASMEVYGQPRRARIFKFMTAGLAVPIILGAIVLVHWRAHLPAFVDLLLGAFIFSIPGVWIALFGRYQKLGNDAASNEEFRLLYKWALSILILTGFLLAAIAKLCQVTYGL